MVSKPNNMQIALIERSGNSNVPLKTADLAAVPGQNDKVIVDLEGTDIIFKVIDVHFFEGSKTEVILVRLSSLTEYAEDPGLLRT